jgi:hypothetical protein
VSLVFPVFYLAARPTESLIGVTTTDLLARLYSGAVKTTFEGDRFRTLFPEVAPETGRGWSQAGLFLKGPEPRAPGKKDPSYVAVGADGSIIGRRADGVVIDDAIDEPTARSDTLLEQRRAWLARSVLSRLKPDGFTIVVGTLWTEGDIVDSAEQSGAYTVVKMQAESPGSMVEAEVAIPADVAWRPAMPYREVDG